MAVTNKDICKTCEDLQQYSPDFVANGVTDEMCSNLESNTGLMNNGRENCTDLHNANDCLIGGIAEKATSYNPCDPNKMIEDLAKNTMHVIDMLICSDCGQWKQIELLWNAINDLLGKYDDLLALIKALQQSVSQIQQRIQQLQNSIDDLDGRVDTNTTNISNATTNLNSTMTALKKILENLHTSGAWSTTGDNVLNGSLNSGRNLATGNINVFGGSTDGNSYIRTNNGKTENDLAGGI